MPKRAALYLRISKDDAQTGLAVERQRAECLDVIDREKLDLVETYTDNGVSAYKRNVKRPAFDRMSKDYELGRFDVVVCWDMDRFSRQPAQLERWIELGEIRGLKILTPTEVTDLSNDNGRMFARMKATWARAEVERKSTRQRAQVVQAKENGTYKARVGFNDTEVIQRIFSDVLGGLKVYAIGAALNVEGLTTITGKSWSGQAVRRVVMTPRHRGTTVTSKTWDDAQALVIGRQRVGAKVKGLYSGVARCSTCQASMTASGDRYKCAYATNHPGSQGHVTVTRAALEAKIDAAMVAAFVFGRDSMDPRMEDVAEIDVDLAKVAEASRKIASLVAMELLEEKDAAEQLRGLKTKRMALESRRTEVVAANAHAQMLDGIVDEIMNTRGRIDLDDVVKVKAKVRERWESIGDEKRRELAKEFLRVTIQPAGQERVDVVHKVVTSLNDES